MAAAVVAGCSSTSPQGFSGPCEQRSSSYLVQYGYRSGTCPKELSEAVVVIGGPSQASGDSSACAGGATETDDHCAVTVDMTCPSSDGFKVTTRGKATWATNGSQGGGTFSITLIKPGGSVDCSGTYVVTYTRQ